jgi:uncharacterized membrane protein YgcG
MNPSCRSGRGFRAAEAHRRGVSRPLSLIKPKPGKNGKPGRNGNGNGRAGETGWPPPDEAELLDTPGSLLPERYESRPVRPFTAIAIRVVLWAAVAFGCVGGIVGILRPPPKAAAPQVSVPPGVVGVPAPVAGQAELVVREWLTATPDEEDELLGLFVERPVLDGLSAGDLSVGRVTTVAGRVLQEQYWAVTVVAEVTETVPVVDPDDPGAGEDGGGERTERQTRDWYLEVPIVGDPEKGLLALTAPAVLPAAPTSSTGWEASVHDPVKPSDDDATLRTVQGFLEALLAGTGDPGRYVAPRVHVTPAAPPLFEDVEVVDLAIDKLHEGEYRVLARIDATTPGGARQQFSYELVVVERVDRLEITQFSGAPTMVAGSARPPDEEGQQGDAGGSGGTGADSESGDGGSDGGGATGGADQTPGSSVPDTAPPTSAPDGAPSSATGG